MLLKVLSWLMKASLESVSVNLPAQEQYLAMLDSLTCERWGRREGEGWRGEDGGGRMERRGGGRRGEEGGRGRKEGEDGGERRGKDGGERRREDGERRVEDRKKRAVDSGKIGKRRVLLNPRSCGEKKDMVYNLLIIMAAQNTTQ
jgi:hypothetical protein